MGQGGLHWHMHNTGARFLVPDLGERYIVFIIVESFITNIYFI